MGTSTRLGREQVHEEAWGNESYPHPFVSCMMPVAALVLTIAVVLIGFSVWAKLLPGTVDIPHITGKPRQEAVALLTHAGLRVEIIKPSQFDEQVPEGAVISARPAEGRMVRKGRMIRLLISAGSAYVKVPSLAGLSQQQATRAVQDSGLQIAKVDTANSDTVPIDVVIKVTPPSGARVPRNSAVTLLISQGPLDVVENSPDYDPTVKSDLLTIELPASAPGPADVRIEVTDDSGTREVFRERHEPGDTVVQNVEGTGKNVVAKVYFGDQLLMTRKL